MAKKKAKTPSKPTRLQLIKSIEKALGPGHRVITYVNTSRPIHGHGGGPGTQLAQDCVRLMYDHLLKMKNDVRRESLKVSLFIISNGGDTAVPWRIISMIREVSSEFNVLVPYNAMSAATMIALGADNIYMGPKGELGPIDPTVYKHPFLPKDGDERIPVSVEDVTSFIAFVKDKYGITHEDELIQSLTALTEQISPLGLGLLNRQHTYIRLVGERLLSSRNDKYEDEKVKRILSLLIEEVTFHGHGISREEAVQSLGLHVGTHPKQDALEDAMWNLYLQYEEDMAFQSPIDFGGLLPPGVESADSPALPLGAIESRYHSHMFEFQFRIKQQRQVPNEIKIHFQLPPGFDAAGSDPQTLQQVLNTLGQQVTPAVQQALQQQAPVIGIAPPEQIKARWEKRR